jgi:hypothetical protein
LHRGREDFALFLKRLVSSAPAPRSCIYATDGFGHGLPIDEYARILYDTRVALCPAGVSSSESFRTFEALKAGCVVITPRKPETWFYRGWPAIELNDWSEANPLINRLLANLTLLEELQIKHWQWWEKVCSEPNVARYMAAEIAAAVACH